MAQEQKIQYINNNLLPNKLSININTVSDAEDVFGELVDPWWKDSPLVTNTSKCLMKCARLYQKYAGALTKEQVEECIKYQMINEDKGKNAEYVTTSPNRGRDYDKSSLKIKSVFKEIKQIIKENNALKKELEDLKKQVEPTQRNNFTDNRNIEWKRIRHTPGCYYIDINNKVQRITFISRDWWETSDGQHHNRKEPESNIRFGLGHIVALTPDLWCNNEQQTDGVIKALQNKLGWPNNRSCISKINKDGDITLTDRTGTIVKRTFTYDNLILLRNQPKNIVFLESRPHINTCIQSIQKNYFDKSEGNGYSDIECLVFLIKEAFTHVGHQKQTQLIELIEKDLTRHVTVRNIIHIINDIRSDTCNLLCHNSGCSDLGKISAFCELAKSLIIAF